MNALPRPGAPRRSADPVDRVLELLDDLARDPRVLEAAAGLDHAGDQDRDQQYEADVLDRPLPAALLQRPCQPDVCVAHQLVDHCVTLWLVAPAAPGPCAPRP